MGWRTRTVAGWIGVGALGITVVAGPQEAGAAQLRSEPESQPEVPPADQAAPGEGDAPAGEGDAPAQPDAPAGEGDAPVGEGDAPAGEGDAPVAEGDTPAGEGDVPAGEGDAPVAEGDPPPSDEGEPAPDEALPTDAPSTEPDEAVTDEPAPDVGPAPDPGPTLDPRPRHRWIYSNLTALRYNPLGLVNEFTTGYRYQLIDKDSVLFRESFIAAQLHTYMTPAYARIGPKIDIQPLALLNLSATYDYTGYFGSFGLFQSFESPTADWSDTELGRRDDSNDPAIDNYSTTGHWVTLAALLQAKVKNVAVRDNLKFYWADYDLRDGDTVYYHQTLDLPQPDRGWTLTNDADLLYLFDFGLTVGVRYTLTHAFYQARHFQASEPQSMPNGPTHRIGPAVLYTFFDRPDKRFNKPTLIVLTQFWAKHRFRTGQDVSAAVPYLVIGFRFTGDILPNPANWNEKTKSRRERKRDGE